MFIEGVVLVTVICHGICGVLSTSIAGVNSFYHSQHCIGALWTLLGEQRLRKKNFIFFSHF